MRKNKKSQAEIVGLVIIVLLITIGLLFVVKFVVLREPSDVKKTFVHSELASNMVKVLLETTTTCKESSVKDLFQDCAAFKRINCEELDSCEMVNDTIGMIVVDSISMLYRLELGKSEEVYDVNAALGRQIAHLVEISRQRKIPILITNQVYSDFEDRDQVKMVGGDLLKYGSKCLIEYMSSIFLPTIFLTNSFSHVS